MIYLAQSMPYGSAWQGTMRDLAKIISDIRRSRAYGRLTLRNTVRLGIIQLYFRNGKLVHIVGNRGDARVSLNDLREWIRAIVRFENGSIPAPHDNVTEEEESLFEEVLSQLQQRGIVARTELPRVIDSNLVKTPQVEQLLTPSDWQIIVEGVRRISLAVAHLVGPKEAMNVLRDILDDCTAAFPALAGIQIASSGFLQVNRTTQLDRMPRAEVLEGFSALIATCQHFCAPIIGEEDAHKLFIQALNTIGPAMVNLGLFQVDYHLLSHKDESR